MKEFTLEDVILFILKNLKSGKEEEKEYIEGIEASRKLDNMLGDVVK